MRPRLDRGRLVRALRTSRGAHTRVLGLAATIIAVVVLVALSLRSTGRETYRDPFQPLPPGSTTCGTAPVREPCLDIVLPGARSFRYALLKAVTATPDTVIVDLGGPGLAVLSGRANLGGFQAEVADLSRRYNLLFLEEPWVPQAAPEGCEPALSRFYQAVRGPADQLVLRGTAVATACRLALVETADRQVDHLGWGFDPTTYPRLVRGITERHALDLKGFVAQSWGSVRLAYLTAIGLDLDFAVLVRPFPVGADALTLIRDRVEAITNTLTSPLRSVASTEVASRSLPVDHVDQLSAVVELGYVSDDYFSASARSILDGTAVAEIGRLSDELWTRYGRDSLSLAKLAHWQEVCGAVAGPLPTVVDSNVRSVDDVLAAEFAPCHSLRARDLLQIAARRNCIVTSPLDTVTPQRLIRERYAFIPDERVIWMESKQRSHGSRDGLRECLVAVLR